MDTETGKIRQLQENETPVPTEVMLADYEAALLKQVEEHERVHLLHDIRSKNNNANRRARKRIAKASRQKNRRIKR